MPKRSVEFFMLDILVAIDTIQRHSATIKNSNDFAADETRYNVILRQLEIIGEAMKQILENKKLQTKPEWRDIVDFRNIVAHEYFGINVKEVFDIVKNEIPLLEKDFIALIKHHEDQEKLTKAFAGIKKDLISIKRIDSINYLEKIERSLRE